MLYSFCFTRLSVRGPMLPWQAGELQLPGPVYCRLFLFGNALWERLGEDIKATAAKIAAKKIEAERKREFGGREAMKRDERGCAFRFIQYLFPWKAAADCAQ